MQKGKGENEKRENKKKRKSRKENGGADIKKRPGGKYDKSLSGGSKEVSNVVFVHANIRTARHTKPMRMRETCATFKP